MIDPAVAEMLLQTLMCNLHMFRNVQAYVENQSWAEGLDVLLSLTRVVRDHVSNLGFDEADHDEERMCLTVAYMLRVELQTGRYERARKNLRHYKLEQLVFLGYTSEDVARQHLRDLEQFVRWTSKCGLPVQTLVVGYEQAAEA
ncbi:MAG: hypothetical protein WAZ14_03215 [Patescibacteria group bacterium]